MSGRSISLATPVKSRLHLRISLVTFLSQAMKVVINMFGRIYKENWPQIWTSLRNSSLLAFIFAIFLRATQRSVHITVRRPARHDTVQLKCQLLPRRSAIRFTQGMMSSFPLAIKIIASGSSLWRTTMPSPNGQLTFLATPAKSRLCHRNSLVTLNSRAIKLAINMFGKIYKGN